MSYTLMNFNIPKPLKESFDELSKQKHISKTSILNGFIEEFCRSELRKLQEDQKLREALEGAKRSNGEVSSNEAKQLTGWVPPAIPSLDDEYDWEERFHL